MTADPLSVLRQYNVDQKEIVEENDRIIMGEHSWPKDVPTCFLEYKTGQDGMPKKYYTLETLLFFLKNKSLKHPEYIQLAAANNIPIVHRPDRRNILAYLNGEIDTCGGIDKSVSSEIPPVSVELTKPDPLSLLRQYTIEGKDVVESDNMIIFGPYSWSKDVRTNFLKHRKFIELGPSAEFYTLETVLFFLKNRSLKHERYKLEANVRGIPEVIKPNQKALLDYLTGRIETCRSIIKNVPHLEVPASDMELPSTPEPPSIRGLCNFSGKETVGKIKQFSSGECSQSSNVSKNVAKFGLARASRRKKTEILLPAKFVENENGCRKLLYGPYSFIKDKELGNRIYWKCEFQDSLQCPARITTTNDKVESEWRSHEHWQSKSPPVVEATEIENETKIKLVDITDLETTGKYTEINSSSGTNIQMIEADAPDVDPLCTMNSKITREDTETVSNLNGTNTQIMKADAQDVDHLSASKSEKAREDTENVNSLKDANTETMKINTQDDNSSNASDLSSVGQAAQSITALLYSISKSFDQMGTKIVDGVTDFQEGELSMISTIYSLHDRVTMLRKFNAASDLQVAPASDSSSGKLRSSAETVDPSAMSNESDTTEVSAPAKQRHSSAKIISHWFNEGESEDDAVSMAAEENVDTNHTSESREPDDIADNLHLSEKITCVCVICDQPISIPPNTDIQVTMEAHLQSVHPRLDPPDSASGSDKDGGEANEESEPPLLPDEIKVEDVAVHFNRFETLKNIATSSGIFISNKNGCFCMICGHLTSLEKHLKTRVHHEKVSEYIKYSSEVKKNHVVSVNPDILAIRQGKLYCIKCQVHLLDPHAFLSHVSRNHEHLLKLDFSMGIVTMNGVKFCLLCDRRLRKFRDAPLHVDSKMHCTEFLKLTTIVQLKSIKFCSLCHVKLFTESQFNSHVNGESHISNLELIETIVDSLKIFKKQKNDFLFHNYS